MGVSSPPAATAAPSDPLHLYAGINWFHDDNLFRLADGVPGYDGQRSDAARQSVVGIQFDKQYGRQGLLMHAKQSKVAFDHFKQLDYTGKDYLARVNWELGNHLSGSAGGSVVQTLAPYADFRSRERNLRVHRNGFADAAWRFHPSWRVRGGAVRDRFSYELPIQRVNDRTETATELGIDYLAGSGSVAGLQWRRLKGDYANARVFSAVVLDDSFIQDELKTRIDWRVTPISSIAILAGHARRKYDGVNARSVSGFNGRATVTSQTRAKLRLNAALYREFTPVESNVVSYALSRGASVGAAWEATSKIRVDATAMAERRAYQANGLSIDAGQLTDTVRRASLNATWTPHAAVRVDASLMRERRSGSLFFGSGSYSASTLTLGLSARY